LGFLAVLVVNHVSLDGILQGPARPDEDTRGGLRHGSWAQQAIDPAMGAAMGERMGQEFSRLFGRRSYDDMLSHWNEVGGPFKDGLDQTRKYVVSSAPDADLPWPNSTLLSGDVPTDIAALRKQLGELDLHVGVDVGRLANAARLDRTGGASWIALVFGDVIGRRDGCR
jgi:dihydrofolate reductase